MDYQAGCCSDICQQVVVETTTNFIQNYLKPEPRECKQPCCHADSDVFIACMILQQCCITCKILSTGRVCMLIRKGPG